MSDQALVQAVVGGVAGGVITATSMFLMRDRITAAVRSRPVFVVIFALVGGLCAGASALIGQAASVAPMVFIPIGFALGFLVIGGLLRVLPPSSS